MSSFSNFSATFPNLGSVLRLISIGKNEIEKNGPRTELCSNKSPVHDPIPFSRLIPPGPGIHAKFYPLNPTNISFISSFVESIAFRISI